MPTLIDLAYHVRYAAIPVRRRILRLKQLVDDPSRDNVGDFLVEVVGEEDPKTASQAKDLLERLEAGTITPTEVVGRLHKLFAKDTTSIEEPVASPVGGPIKLPRRKVSVAERSYGLPSYGRLPAVRVLGNRLRARWDDQHNFIMLEELPGKPHKVKLGLAIYTDNMEHKRNASLFLPTNIARRPHPITSGMSFDQALDALEKNYQAAIDLWIDEAEKELAETPGDVSSYERVITGTHWLTPIDLYEVHYLKVTPASTDPIEVSGKDFAGTVGWTEFSFYSPSSDFSQPDPYYIEYGAKSPAAARRLYQLLKAKPGALGNVTWSQFSTWLRQNKVAYESHHSVWR
jgi:hypothetical protein